jgi:phosphoribosyl-ATP pyrophosphohydrolase
VVEEAADLVYHLYVLLAARGLDIARLDDVLRARALS